MAIPSLHEAEDRGLLADQQGDDRAQRDADSRGRQDSEDRLSQPREDALNRRGEPGRHQDGPGEVQREQRPDRRDGRVEGAEVLLEVVNAHGEQGGSPGVAQRPLLSAAVSHCRSWLRLRPPRTTRRRTGSAVVSWLVSLRWCLRRFIGGLRGVRAKGWGPWS